MKSLRWQVKLGGMLLLLTILLYALHFLIFRDARHIGIYFLGDLAFLPIQVLLVSLIVAQLLVQREKEQKLDKMNMVIGAFFSEAGTRLLKSFSTFDVHAEDTCRHLQVRASLAENDRLQVKDFLRQYDFAMSTDKGDLEALKAFLVGKRTFLLTLLENPNLLEHDTFTELLWAVFHLMEELSLRPAFAGLPPSDHDHLAADMKRAYRLLIEEWLEYLWHLKRRYPYLFSLSIRTNPFDRDASVIVR